MKSVIKYSILMICFSVSILLVMDINSISQRKSEMEGCRRNQYAKLAKGGRNP